MSDVVTNDREWQRIQQEVETYSNAVARVGIFDQDIAEYAAANEYGTSTIPERSFIRSTLDAHQDDIYNRIGSEYDNVLAGRKSAAAAINDVGDYLTQLVQQKVRSGPFTPNAQSTIEAKGSSKPLIDSGDMLRAITSETSV